jgi:shikimate kinase
VNIILFGFKGSGKTHLGKLLAKRLNRTFIDTDDLLIDRFLKNCSIRELYQTVGEEKFRSYETSVIKSLSRIRNSVISLGGGAVLSSENVDLLLKMGKLIYLKASFETIQKRMQEMPAFVKGPLETIYRTRIPIYESIPAHKVNVDSAIPARKIGTT